MHCWFEWRNFLCILIIKIEQITDFCFVLLCCCHQQLSLYCVMQKIHEKGKSKHLFYKSINLIIQFHDFISLHMFRSNYEQKNNGFIDCSSSWILFRLNNIICIYKLYVAYIIIIARVCIRTERFFFSIIPFLLAIKML